MADVFRPETTRGFRWDDDAFRIAWPQPPRMMSPRDAGYPDFRRLEPTGGN
jgi:dTDP-4-dehydrorhamnose 3,5-epimerase